ncbi:hypothetical protein C5L14_13975 [Labrys okinawensis]|uniref:Uncharacterized protein n=1 Tax=Labrys okinawensis TaxID=346911 RepID=A0A2S9QAS8_9HYPH|nr:hypothetical protein [Labrys okinawensis]PRH86449.1 hypothetical protein C5L14_13975 [Labrys okinawensis]
MTVATETHADIDAAIVNSILEATRDDGPALPEERARTLLLAWILSREDGVDLAREAADLKVLLLEASSADNLLLPHLSSLLDEVRDHAGQRRGRRRLRADA